MTSMIITSNCWQRNALFTIPRSNHYLSIISSTQNSLIQRFRTARNLESLGSVICSPLVNSFNSPNQPSESIHPYCFHKFESCSLQLAQESTTERSSQKNAKILFGKRLFPQCSSCSVEKKKVKQLRVDPLCLVQRQLHSLQLEEHHREQGIRLSPSRAKRWHLPVQYQLELEKVDQLH